MKIKQVVICTGWLQLNYDNNLTKECNYEIVNVSKTRPNCTKLYRNFIIRFCRVTTVQLLLNTVFLTTKPKFIYISGKQQSIISFIKIKNLLLNCQ